MTSIPLLWRSSLRLRLTVAGVGLAAAIFAIGGAVTIPLYSRSLTLSLRHSAAQTASAIGSRVTTQWLPDPIPMPTGLDIPRVQVLDSNGSVVTGDPSSADKPAMYLLPAGLNSQQVTIDSPLFGGSDAIAYVVRVTTPAGPETVVAALPLSQVTSRVSRAVEATAGVGTGALIVVGVVAWLTAGRVLRPVERMRGQATEITASGDPSGRLPNPGTDELSKLAETLNGMLASLEGSVERQRSFVADAAHELRTPLAGLTAALEIAQQHPEVPRDTLVSELLAGHRRLSRTLNDLLVLAALDGRVQQRMTSVDLIGVVTDCSRRSVPDGVYLGTGALQRAVVLGSESQLSRMVGNLVDNALRYCRGKVEVSVTVSGRWARVAVADDGPGIPTPDRERVWDRFVRLDDDRSRVKGGSGLGLAIVRDIAVTHGGTVSISTGSAGEAPPGPGAEFVIRLPLLDAEPSR